MPHSPLARFFFGPETPGLTAFADVALFRLALLYPFCVLASNSLTDVWDLLLILFWLLSGHWAEKIQTIKNSPVLIVTALLVAISFLGVFQTEESLFRSIKYWRGHHPFPILIVLATILPTKIRRIQMLNSLGITLMVLILYSFCVYPCSPFEELQHLREAAIARNTIWFGMALVVWCGLCICVPYAVRLNPALRPFLRGSLRTAMRTVARISTWDYLLTIHRQSCLVHGLQLLRMLGILFCLAAIFLVNPSRTAWVAILVGITALLLWWNWRKGIVISLILGVVCCSAGYRFSENFMRKATGAGREITQFVEQIAPGQVDDRPLNGRLPIYLACIKHIAHHPHGFGMIETQKFCRSITLEKLDNCHSEFIAFALHSGWLGLGILCSLFFYLAKQIGHLGRMWKQLALFVGVTLLVACVFNGAFSQDMEGPLYCILLALLASAEQKWRKIKVAPGPFKTSLT